MKISFETDKPSGKDVRLRQRAGIDPERRTLGRWVRIPFPEWPSNGRDRYQQDEERHEDPIRVGETREHD